MSKIPELYREWLSMQPLNLQLERDINQQFMVDFNYNSNHLEGNTLTYGQTKLLLLFGDTIGNASIQDYEEMKAHNVGLELLKIAASDRERTLSENLIRELNHTILVRDFYKTSRDGDFRYKIHVGVYKTRPNSVITPTGELFDYASPEETPSLMSDLVRWYNDEEEKGEMTPAELSSLFHYRYIRIHPFEDGNGRIARLLVNYILLRNNYPMIVIRTDDRQNYLKALHQCDLLTGKKPHDGAHATLQQTKPLFRYISTIIENKLTALIQLAKGEIRELVETRDDSVNAGVNAGVDNVVDAGVKLSETQIKIINCIRDNNTVTQTEMSNLLKVNETTIYRNMNKLKGAGIITREGSDKAGKWVILKTI
jgi:Fic family protein